MIIQEGIWKDIPETKGYYQASSLGNIRSVERKISSGRKCGSKLIKPILTNKYYSVSICIEDKKNIRVHKLVAIAFSLYVFSTLVIISFRKLEE